VAKRRLSAMLVCEIPIPKVHSVWPAILIVEEIWILWGTAYTEGWCGKRSPCFGLYLRAFCIHYARLGQETGQVFFGCFKCQSTDKAGRRSCNCFHSFTTGSTPSCFGRRCSHRPPLVGHLLEPVIIYCRSRTDWNNSDGCTLCPRRDSHGSHIYTNCRYSNA